VIPGSARGCAALTAFVFSAAISHAQMERPLAWLQDLRELQRRVASSLTAEQLRVTNIRADIENWLNLHPDSSVGLAPSPTQPWSSEQVAIQITLLRETVENILRQQHERTFDLGVTVVNVTDSVSSLSPVADSIDQTEIRNRDAVTVNQAIEYLPGVSVDHKSPRNQTGISIRGFDTRQVPLYLDGIPIYVPYDGYVDLTRFLTGEIAEIEVSKGYSSPLSGPNGLGGAINLVTREPQAKFEAEASIGTGSGDILDSWLHLGSRWRYFFIQGAIEWLQSDYFPLSGNFPLNVKQPSNHRVNSDQRDERFSGRVGWTPKGQDAYVFSYANQKGSYGVPPYSGIDPACPSGNNTVLYPCVTPKYWKWPYWNKNSYYFNGSKSLGEGSSVKFRAFYDQYRNSMEMYDDATYSTLYKNTSSGISNYDDHSIGTSAEFKTRLLRWNVISASVFLKDDTHREDAVVYSSKNIPSASPWQSDRDQQTSIGIQDVIAISSRIHATAGFSADHLNGLQAQDLNSAKTQLVPFQVQGSAPRSTAFRSQVVRITSGTITRSHRSLTPSTNLEPCLLLSLKRAVSLRSRTGIRTSSAERYPIRR
jgi:iron complex outermembrane receptor protein